MISVRKVIVPAVVIGSIVVTASILLRYQKLRQFAEVPYDYEPRPEDTLICTRPMEHPVVKHLWPVFHHTYFKNDGGTFGFEYCSPISLTCSNLKGPQLLPDRSSNAEKHRCYVVSTDPQFRKCAIERAKNIYKQFDSPGLIVSLLRNRCAVFTDTIASECSRQS